MSYEIRITPQARDDLRGIFAYIALDLQSPQSAASQFARLEESIDSLDEMPERFLVYDKEPWRSRNLRIMSVDNYLVFYVPNRQENTVTVIRVMYGGRDVDRRLDDLLEYKENMECST